MVMSPGGALSNNRYTGRSHPTASHFLARALELGTIYGLGLQDWVSFGIFAIP